MKQEQYALTTGIFIVNRERERTESPVVSPLRLRFALVTEVLRFQGFGYSIAHGSLWCLGQPAPSPRRDENKTCSVL